MNFKLKNMSLKIVKLKILNYFEKHYLIIARLLLWFHRILGLTFGGLVIDSNGKLSFNKYYKYYGYLVLIAFVSYDSIHFIIIHSQEMIEVSEKSKISKSVPYILASVGMAWNAYKIVNLYHFNRHGMKFIKILVEIISEDIKHLFSFRVVFTLFFWLIFMVRNLVFTLTTVKNSGKKLGENIAILESTIVVIYFWSISSLTWIVSMVYSKKLTDIEANLKLFIIQRSGSILFC